MKTRLVFIISFFLVTNLVAQVPALLQQRLQGKTKLTDIMREVEAFYKDNHEILDSSKDYPEK